MKIGDWVEYRGERWLVYNTSTGVGGHISEVVDRYGRNDRFCVNQLTPLPDCTGWDWKPEPKWRPATIEDAIRAIRGETVKCRVRNDGTKNGWENAELKGHAAGWGSPWFTHCDNWHCCEVPA